MVSKMVEIFCIILLLCVCLRPLLLGYFVMFFYLNDGLLFVCGTFRIQEQLRRIKRNEQKEKLQPVKKKKEKPPNNVSGTVCSQRLWLKITDQINVK